MCLVQVVGVDDGLVTNAAGSLNPEIPVGTSM